MHLNNLNKGSRKLKFLHDKNSKKKFSYYACSKEGYIAQDC